MTMSQLTEKLGKHPYMSDVLLSADAIRHFTPHRKVYRPGPFHLLSPITGW